VTDLMTVLAQSYRANVLSSTPGSGKYVAVDPTLYQGTWSGKYSDNKSFSISISDISDYRAKVRYQSDGTVKYQEVLIKDSSFRFGDTKFTLTGQPGQALIKNVVTDPATGSTYLDQAYATQSS
jgi:hypothetical protein